LALGHIDAKSRLGFDIVVLATDSFFRAMFFLQSGLFVWPGLGHKSPIPAGCNRLEGRPRPSCGEALVEQEVQ
jgi:hypothetical protein